MKNKLIFLGIFAVVVIAAMFIYRETLSLEGLILILLSNIAAIRLLWLWLNKKEEASNLKNENNALRAMHKVEFRKNNLNTNTMSDTEAEVILQQLNYVKNNLPNGTLRNVVIETIENLESVIGGGGIKNPPPTS